MGHRKVDVAKALELRVKKGLSFKEISRYFDCSLQAVEQSLSKFTKLLKDDLNIETYKINKADILSSMELTLINDLADEGKRDKASLNNIAYALKEVNNMNRLEQGQATHNVQYADLSDSLEDIQKEKAELLESIAKGEI